MFGYVTVNKPEMKVKIMSGIACIIAASAMHSGIRTVRWDRCHLRMIQHLPRFF